MMNFFELNLRNNEETWQVFFISLKKFESLRICGNHNFGFKRRPNGFLSTLCFQSRLHYATYTQKCWPASLQFRVSIACVRLRKLCLMNTGSSFPLLHRNTLPDFFSREG